MIARDGQWAERPHNPPMNGGERFTKPVDAADARRGQRPLRRARVHFTSTPVSRSDHPAFLL
jgi:hypothetical protein